jgi:hypothetical protein
MARIGKNDQNVQYSKSNYLQNDQLYESLELFAEPRRNRSLKSRIVWCQGLD